jgi:hypothetical protein
MSIRVGFFAAFALVVGCATGGRGSVKSTGPAPLDTVIAAEHIGAAPRFVEPIRVEVPSVGRGPTFDALVAAGLINVDPDVGRPFNLTAAGQAAGFTSFEFQGGLPVYKIPIGERKLISIVQIEAESVGDAIATFTYRRIPTELGTEMIRHGARIAAFDDGTLHDGHAVFSRTETGWTVVSVGL